MTDTLQVETTGNFHVMEEVIQDIPRFMKVIGPRISRKVAVLYLAKLKEFWENQTFELAPLNPAYLDRKKNNELDQRILMATQRLFNKLQVIQVDSGTAVDSSFMVGVEDSALSTLTGVPYSTIIQVLEYGSESAGIPARPIFWLTKLAVEQDLIKLVQKELVKESALFYGAFAARAGGSLRPLK